MTDSHNTPRTLLTRRMFGAGALTACAALPVIQACSGGRQQLICGSAGLTAQQNTMRSTLQYTEHAADPNKACKRCALYTGNETSCGTCTLVAGQIHPEGSCASFAPRPT